MPSAPLALHSFSVLVPETLLVGNIYSAFFTLILVANENSIGRMASLGILSAWEPCGGILCANLPLVYRALVQMVKTVRDTVQGTTKKDTNAVDSHRPSEAQLSHDWTRLNNSGNVTSSVDELNPELTTKTSIAMHQYELNSIAASKREY